MNIERAKSIALSEIFEKINSVSTQQTLSCITALFKGNSEVDGISVVKAYLNSRREGSTDADAVRWINIMFDMAPRIAAVTDILPASRKSKYRIEKSYPIKEQGLLNDLATHRTPIHISRHHVYELSLYNKETKKPFFAFGYKNEENGNEVFNPFVQTTIGRSGITFIRGTCQLRHCFHVFVHVRDFLAAVSFGGNGYFLKEDAIILNSMHNLPKASPYIYQYGYKSGFTWMNNDETGKRATDALSDYFQTENNLRHCPMNKHYRRFTSLHECFKAKWNSGRNV